MVHFPKKIMGQFFIRRGRFGESPDFFVDFFCETFPKLNNRNKLNDEIDHLEQHSSKSHLKKDST